METRFHPAEFVRRIGQDLVRQFNDARQATTSGLVGNAMEESVAERLKQILPRGVGVGSGCVIDVYGATSRQMDIVLYEEGQCPVFRVSSPKASYFPCEGVLAVGEVKSRVGKKELADAFEKIKSVKALRRAFKMSGEHKMAGRTYGSNPEVAHGFDFNNTNRGDIFGFIVAEESAVDIPNSLLSHYARNIETLKNDVLSPDLTVFLQGEILKRENCVDDRQGKQQPGPYVPTRSHPVLPHTIVPVKSESPFSELILAIWEHHGEGLTAHIPLKRYLHYIASDAQPQYVFAVIVNSGIDTKKLEADMAAGKDVRIATPITPTDHLQSNTELLRRVMRKGD